LRLLEHSVKKKPIASCLIFINRGPS